jgi:hypothetical protein
MYLLFVMRGYVFVAEEAKRSKKELQRWLYLCLALNGQSKASKKKTKNK